MDFKIKSGNPKDERSGCVAVGVFENQRLSPAAQQLDTASKGQITHLLKRGDMDGKVGQCVLLHDVPSAEAERILLVGCGRDNQFSAKQFGEVIQQTVTTLGKTGAKDATSYLTDIPVQGRDLFWKIQHSVQIMSDALYRFERLKSKRAEDGGSLRKVIVATQDRYDQGLGKKAILQGQAVANGVKLAKDLANLPGNHCTPSYLAEQARELQQRYDPLKARVVNPTGMEKLGMEALLSVARGSRQPAKLITLEYHGGKKNAKPIVLVGKGITFDSGGISIKPAPAMDEMKFDMCGAASVLGAISAAAELKLPVNVVGVIPSCENMPDGNANKPGDIITSLSGQTIEILNTDAEGRLILCDALTYTERYKPSMVIDIATLTGACVIALGKHASGLFANHQPLAESLLAAGEIAGDRAWQLPLWDDYQQQLDSNFADMANIGGRDAGSITAACFLSRFAKKFQWAHLDIAGTAWQTGKEKGATGRPVPLLVQYLIDRTT